MNPVIVYSRMSSTRLPGKALKFIHSFRLLDLICQRLSRRFAGRIIIATGLGSENEPIEKYALENNIKVYRGHDQNLVSRTLGVIQEYPCDYFIRVNGDAPFVDPELIFNAEKMAYRYSLVTNIKRRTFPYGVSVEVVNSKRYEALDVKCTEEEAEHVTMHLYRILKSKEVLNIDNILNLNMQKLPAFTIDTQEDLDRIKLETVGEDLLRYKPSNYEYKLF